MCTSFGKESDDLCNALALFARSLCSRFCDPSVLVPLLACCLIATYKNPGVRPIGIGEMVRHIVAKAAISVVKSDLLDSIRCKQLSVSQVGGVEAAVYSVRKLFDSEESVIFVDTSNVLNTLNRMVALHNVRSTCPPPFGSSD